MPCLLKFGTLVGMIIIGEKINSTRKDMARAISQNDAAYIQDVALEQANAGASWLDVNCATQIDDEAVKMAWLVKIVQGRVNVPLSIDSPNPLAIEAGLKVHQGQAIINSTTAEPDRIEKIFPLAHKYNAGVIALCIDEKGMPRTAQDRFDIAKKLFKMAFDYKIPPEDLYIDPLVRPVATEPEQVEEFLESLRMIKTLKGVKTICGLSNVSFGLPDRKLLNATFAVMALAAGLDAAILDPTDKAVLAGIKAAEALLNHDEYCLNYITAHRENKLR